MHVLKKVKSRSRLLFKREAAISKTTRTIHNRDTRPQATEIRTWIPLSPGDRARCPEVIAGSCSRTTPSTTKSVGDSSSASKSTAGTNVATVAGGLRSPGMRARRWPSKQFRAFNDAQRRARNLRSESQRTQPALLLRKEPIDILIGFEGRRSGQRAAICRLHLLAGRLIVY